MSRRVALTVFSIMTENAITTAASSFFSGPGLRAQGGINYSIHLNARARIPVLEEPAGKRFHDSFDLLGLAGQPKALQKHAQRLVNAAVRGDTDVRPRLPSCNSRVLT